MKENVQQLFDLMDRTHEAETAWFRQILTLSAGALAVLAGLGPEIPPEGPAQYFLAATWVCLGSGICTGAGALYLAVDRSRRLASHFREELHRSLREETPMQPVVANPRGLLVRCRPAMVVSLISAVICLTGYAVATTLVG